MGVICGGGGGGGGGEEEGSTHELVRDAHVVGAVYMHLARWRLFIG